MATPYEIDEQRALIGQLRSDCGFLLTALESLTALRPVYDQLQLDDDTILDDQALIPLGTHRAALRQAIGSLDELAVLLTRGHGDRLARFARGG
jgi:hypothetical protein